jgi:hypothetical protein
MLTPGSTLPIAETRNHAGIVRTRRFAFDMPAMADPGTRIAP